MAICDLGHEHADPVAEAPVIVEADPGPNENDVAIAEIEAAARVETERIYAEEADQDLREEVARLRGELAGVRETLATFMPEPADPPEPAPVIVQTETGPGDSEEAAAVPETEGTPPPAKATGGGYWSAYR